ncbi:MAG: type II toxin-antitoxin system HicA family toxin [Actinomycetota bacterium]
MANVAFSDAELLAIALGFRRERLRGSHHIYKHPAVEGRLNLQPIKGPAKGYQLKQLMELVEAHGLGLED